MEYTSLSGYVCKTTSDRVIEYPVKLLELFLDPITCELMKNPIIVGGYPNNIYDKGSLINWYLISDVEPLLGISVGKKLLKFRHVINFDVAMLLLEEREKCLVWHQPEIDVCNLISLVSKIKSSEVREIVVNLDSKFYKKTSDVKDDMLTLEDVLLYDIVSGGKIGKAVISGQGVYHGENSEIVRGYLDEGDIEINMLFNRIKNTIEQCGSLRVGKNRGISRMMLDPVYGNYFSDYHGLALRKDDFYLESTPRAEAILKEYKKIVNLESRPDFIQKREYLSKILRENLEIVTHPEENQNGFAKLRADVDFPILNNLKGWYTDDFSLLNLADLRINGVRRDVKGREFIGTDLSRSMVYNMVFRAASFIGAKLVGTIFDSCIFHQCRFTGAQLIGTKFVACLFDEITEKEVSVIEPLPLPILVSSSEEEEDEED
ncbi:MAG: hypothetical protein Hyperionvirus18_20 [Hyperionvirus sp.]|uniref:Uncharacterized protein n=1 Tax=Hyperionvirus sp. TaxID=2487770 RepID=A0A3G5AC40_9VIRU|nr:MAG: hypothetical protein Hyperionvirus18_20 [Hyperionvirus sp.]